MGSFYFKYILPLYMGIVLLDLNEFVTRFLGSEEALSFLIFVLSVILVLAAKPIKGGGGALNIAFLIAFISFLALGVFAMFLEGDGSRIAKDVRYYIPSLLVYFAVFRSTLSVHSESQLIRIIAVAAVFIGVNAIFILLSIIFNIDFHGSTGEVKVERAVGLYSNANRAGYVSTIGQSLALLLLLSPNVRFKNFYFGLYLLCLLAAFSTFSKGTILLSLLLMARVFYLALIDSKRSTKKKYVQRLSVLIIIVVISSVFGLFNFQSRFSALQSERLNEVQLLLQGVINDETTTHRYEYVTFALQDLSDTFFLGAGLGKFKKMEIGNGTHNIYLLILGEAGVIALICYLIFLLRWARKSFGSKNFSALKFASGNVMIIFFFSGFVAHTLLANKQYILILAVLIAALRVRELTGKFYL